MSPAEDVAEVNRRFYGALWSAAELQDPKRFNTWPLIEPLAAAAAERLEVGPGLRPRLPLDGTHFIDASEAAVARLRESGGRASVGDAGALPFADASIDLACAFDVIEHLADDGPPLRELARVLRPGGVLIASVPLHPEHWNDFDAFVGHARRYRPVEFRALLETHGFALERSVGFGMQPANGPLLRWGMWWLRKHPVMAMRWYNRLILPIGLRLQPRLALVDGWLDDSRNDEVMVVCRRRAA